MSFSDVVDSRLASLKTDVQPSDLLSYASPICSEKVIRGLTQIASVPRDAGAKSFSVSGNCSWMTLKSHIFQHFNHEGEV